MTPMSHTELWSIIHSARTKSLLTFTLEFGNMEMRRHINQISLNLASSKRVELALSLYYLATLKSPSPLEVSLAGLLFVPGHLTTPNLFAQTPHYSLEQEGGLWVLTIWQRYQLDAPINERNIPLWTMTSSIKERLTEIIPDLQKICPIQECFAEIEAQINSPNEAA
jgi:hypothetical protein